MSTVMGDTSPSPVVHHNNNNNNNNNNSNMFIPQLLSENAQLKTKVGIPEQERVLQDVLNEQLQYFFIDAKFIMENAITKALGLSEEENNNNNNNNGSQRFAVLVETLNELRTQNETLLQNMSEIQTQRVMGLNKKIEKLEFEKETLKQRIIHLEEETKATNETLPLPLLAELRSLRSNNKILLEQLELIQKRGENAVMKTDKLVKNGIQASLALPQLIDQLEEMRNKLHCVETEKELFRLQLSEAEDRESVRNTLREKQLEDQITLQQSTIETLLNRNTKLKHREVEANTIIASQKETIAKLENSMKTLQTQQEASTGEEATLAAKRYRFEKEIINNPNSIRRDCITFYQQGREELEQSREELQQLRLKERQLRAIQEKITQMKRTRATFINKLATLADEMHHLRNENQTLRAQYTGIEVERDYLNSSLASVISHHMQEDEIKKCCNEIRNAAEKSAAASASVVADPQIIKEVMRQSQEIKNEVTQLQKQKEKLYKVIALYEERLSARITRDMMQHTTTKINSENNEKIIGGNKIKRGGIETDISQILNFAQLQAADILSSLEENVETEGSIKRHEKFLDMQKKIIEMEEELKNCQKQLNNVIIERDDARKQLENTQNEMNKTLSLQEATMKETLNINLALKQSTDALQTEKKKLRESYDASVSFTKKLSKALTGLLELLQTKTSFAASLSKALQEERVEIEELTRRTTEVWDTHKGEVQSVLEAIERMQSYISQTAEEQQRTHNINEIKHLHQLIETVKDQEERLKELQNTFTQTCKEFSEGLAKRIKEAEQSRDVRWKKQVETLSEKQQQLQAKLGAEKDLLTNIERTLLVPTSSSTTTNNNNTNTTNNNSIVNTNSDIPSTLTDKNEIGEQVLEAINQLFTAISIQQGVINNEEEEEENENENEEQQQQQDEEVIEAVNNEEEEKKGEYVATLENPQLVSFTSDNAEEEDKVIEEKEEETTESV